eukprot:1083009-Rhodomonas_salina.1
MTSGTEIAYAGGRAKRGGRESTARPSTAPPYCPTRSICHVPPLSNVLDTPWLELSYALDTPWL